MTQHTKVIPDIAASEGISEATLYNWLKQAKHQGVPVPGSIPTSSENWSGEAKLAESAALLVLQKKYQALWGDVE